MTHRCASDFPCCVEEQRNTQQILACDPRKCFMFDVLRNAFVLALGTTVLPLTVILLPAFVLEGSQQGPGLIPRGVSLLGWLVCQEPRLSRTKEQRGHKASGSSCQKAVRLSKASRPLSGHSGPHPKTVANMEVLMARSFPPALPPLSLPSPSRKCLMGFGALTVPQTLILYWPYFFPNCFLNACLGCLLRFLRAERNICFFQNLEHSCGHIM